MRVWITSKSMEESLKRCLNFPRKDAKAQRKTQRLLLSLRPSPLLLCAFAGAILFVCSATAQTKPTSERVAATAMTALWRDNAGYPAKWTYDHGLVLKGIERVWHNTGNKQYLDFIQRSMDHFVTNDGSIRTYSIDDYNIDNILPGRNLLFLYRITGQEKYRKAAALLREQLKTHPRTSEGGF